MSLKHISVHLIGLSRSKMKVTKKIVMCVNSFLINGLVHFDLGMVHF